jgi:rhodanese-related sulfurtransferase
MANQRVQQSCVLSTPAGSSTTAQTFFASKLHYETDPADVYADMQNGVADFVLLDVRSPEAYARSHAPGAINLPQGMINAEAMAPFATETLLVVYCWGPGCNGATKAALKLSALGFSVKEMIGGIEYWENKQHYPVERGGTPAPGRPSAP